MEKSTNTQAVVGGYKTRNRSVPDPKGNEQIQLPKEAPVDLAIDTSARTPKLIIEKLSLIDLLPHCHYIDVRQASVCETQREESDTSESDEYQWTLHVSTTSEEDAQEASSYQSAQIWEKMISARYDLKFMIENGTKTKVV